MKRPEEEKNIINTLHELKILPEWFHAMMFEGKDFEIRKNDRCFEVGDKLLMREWDPMRSYTGNYIEAKIKYVYQGTGVYGVSEEYCILGLEEIVCTLTRE